MDTIFIKDLLKLNSYSAAGDRFYSLAKDIIGGGNIKVDMADVDSVPTIFMNAAFLPLVKDYGKEQVMRSLLFLHIQRSQLLRIKNYFTLIPDA